MYREHPPIAALEPYVDCFWTKSHDVGFPAMPQRVLPDGCIDILFYLGGARTASSFVAGTMTRAILVEAARQERIVAVRFRPGAAIAFLATPAHALTDLHVALDDLWHDVEPLRERLAGVAPAGGVQELQRELLARLPRAHPLDPLVRGAIDALYGRDRPVIGDLAESLGVSRQHLARQFKVHVGIGPKEFDRVIRMTRLTRRLTAPARPENAAALAYELGYYDQSHMIHEFKALAGLTPRAYARQASQTSQTSPARDSISPIRPEGAGAHSPSRKGAPLP